MKKTGRVQRKNKRNRRGRAKLRKLVYNGFKQRIRVPTSFISYQNRAPVFSYFYEALIFGYLLIKQKVWQPPRGEKQQEQNRGIAEREKQNSGRRRTMNDERATPNAKRQTLNAKRANAKLLHLWRSQ